MSLQSIVDLSALPEPNVIEVVSYQEIRDEILSGFPELLPSDPSYKMAEACAYQIMRVRMRINDAVKATLVKYAKGPDLDNLLLIPRLVITPADPNATPPVEEVLESDEDYVRRALLANEKLTNAGTPNAYLAHALEVDPTVKDAFVGRLEPGHVLVTVLSRDNGGVPSAATIAAISDRLHRRDIKPVNDTVTVQAATIRNYEVSASLVFFPNQNESAVLAEAQAAVEAYVEEASRIGHTVARAKLFAALARPGVSNVNLLHPVEDIDPTVHEASLCTSIVIVDGGVDE